MRVRHDPHGHSVPDRLRRLGSSRPARRALLRRAAALSVCTAVCLAVVHRVQDADRVRERWGATTHLLVTTRDLPPGALLAAGDVRLVEWPEAHAPSGSIDALPHDRRLSAPVAAGEVLVAHRFAAIDRGEWTAMLAPDQVAVQLPLPAPLPGVAVGDLVDVIAPDGATLPDVSGGVVVERVASGARVLHLDEQHATLAVRRDEAAATAGAALGGLVAVVVTP
jgi:Flp pilus assembly protein CpaB